MFILSNRSCLGAEAFKINPFALIFFLSFVIYFGGAFCCFSFSPFSYCGFLLFCFIFDFVFVYSFSYFCLLSSLFPFFLSSLFLSSSLFAPSVSFFSVFSSYPGSYSLIASNSDSLSFSQSIPTQCF